MWGGAFRIVLNSFSRISCSGISVSCVCEHAVDAWFLSCLVVALLALSPHTCSVVHAAVHCKSHSALLAETSGVCLHSSFMWQEPFWLLGCCFFMCVTSKLRAHKTSSNMVPSNTRSTGVKKTAAECHHASCLCGKAFYRGESEWHPLIWHKLKEQMQSNLDNWSLKQTKNLFELHSVQIEEVFLIREMSTGQQHHFE